MALITLGRDRPCIYPAEALARALTDGTRTSIDFTGTDSSLFVSLAQVHSVHRGEERHTANSETISAHTYAYVGCCEMQTHLETSR